MPRASALRKALVLASIAFANVRAGVSPDTGSYIFQHFTADRYTASPQNWDIAQDPRGVMYFGNTDGVLEFDGISWRKIRLNNGSFARALAVEDGGTVYVGGVGTFGLLRADESGTMAYLPLIDKVPVADRQFSDVWRILPTRDGVYFSSYQRLFRLQRDGSLKVWKPTSNFGRAFSMQGQLYVKTPEKGLMRMQGDQLAPVPGGTIFQKIGITAGLSRGGGGLIATPTGFYRLDDNGLQRFPTAADSYFEANLLYTFYAFEDGEIAAGTRKGGVVLLNRDGGIDRILTKESGLTDDYVTAIYSDRQRGVWLAGNNGISRLNSGMSRYEANLGLLGAVECVARAGGVLYAGGKGGLFRLDSSRGNAAKFERIEGIETAVRLLQTRGNDLLIATESGSFQLSAGKLVEIAKPEKPFPVFDLSPSPRDPNTIYRASLTGVVRLLNKGGAWLKDGEFTVPGQELRSVVEDPDGRVWATTREAIYRIDFRTSEGKPERLGEAEGAPIGWKNAKLFAGHIVFATTKGLRRFNEASHRFEPDPILGTQFSNGSRDVFSITDGVDGNVWVTGERYHGVLFKQATGYKWLPSPLLGAGIGEIYGMWVDPDGVAWAVGAKQILHRWERRLYGDPDLDFQVLPRRVESIDKKLMIYGGAGEFRRSRLDYSRNALRFVFTAPFTEDPSAVEYQVQLEGADAQYSAWGYETQKDYTNLPEGSYRFRVRARSPHGTVSENTSLGFAVAPPWYRTWWAYVTYLLFGGFGVWGIVRWRTHKLEAEKRQLEVIVAERTVEIRDQRDEIHRQERKGNSLLLNILPEAVAEELKSTGSVKPVGFDEVTVCFTDFVGFTLSSEKMQPAKLVDALNQYFTKFDEIATRYGVEKLKTIGDSYMFVSGLPARRGAHAVDAVMAALEMVEVVKELAPLTGWGIRVGLHSGPVVAGVVGIRKFAFDIWGTTVNFAARMESSGVPGRVNMSEATRGMIDGLIACEERGQVRIKEGRELPMFLAAGIEGDPAEFAVRYTARFGEQPPIAVADMLGSAQILRHS